MHAELLSKSLDYYTHAQSPATTPCARRRWRTRCAARPCPSQTHGPRPPRRPRRPQHAVQPQSGRCAVRVPRRDDTMVKCRRCVVVSGAGVTSYDRRWYWCRHAHTSSRHAPAPNLHICLLRRHLVDCRSSLAPCVLTAASEASRQHYWCRRLVELVTAAAVACCHELK